MNSTNLGPILIFGSCVVGTCKINFVGELFHLMGRVPLLCIF